MAGVYGNSFAYMKDSGGSVIDTLAKTATFDTEWIDIGSADFFGFIIEATVTGTSPTLDIDVELTWDGGTSVVDYPAFADIEAVTTAESGIRSAGIADFAQITATSNTAKFFKNFIPNGASGGLNPQVRLECTIAGTNPSFTLSIVKVQKNSNLVV